MQRAIRNLTPCAVLCGALALAPAARADVPAVILLEIDYMEDAFHTHRPSQDVLDALVAMFACQGITLAIVVSDAVPHVPVVRCDDPDEDDFFDCITATSFAFYKTVWGQTAGSGWHYCLIGHDYDAGNGTGSSGRAELDGNDLVVTLGSFNGGSGGTDFEIAATIAHELGHNLGLTHDSPASVLGPGNFTPNYASIMSYQYQLAGVRTRMQCLGLVTVDNRLKDLDYSHGRLPGLVEAALSEAKGAGMHAVDWDCDGELDPGAVGAELDIVEGWCGTPEGFSLLSDWDDWANIEDSSDSLEVATDAIRHEALDCLTVDDHERMQAGLDGLVDPSVCAGSAPPVLVTEPCTSGLMVWVDASWGGVPVGTGSFPFVDLASASLVSPANSVLYLQPGTYTNGGQSLVLSSPRVLAGPGGAVIDP